MNPQQLNKRNVKLPSKLQNVPENPERKAEYTGLLRPIH